MLGLSDRAVNDVLDGFCVRGESRKIHFLWRPHISDPKDDVLAPVTKKAVANETKATATGKWAAGRRKSGRGVDHG